MPRTADRGVVPLHLLALLCHQQRELLKDRSELVDRGLDTLNFLMPRIGVGGLRGSDAGPSSRPCPGGRGASGGRRNRRTRPAQAYLGSLHGLELLARPGPVLVKGDCDEVVAPGPGGSGSRPAV